MRLIDADALLEELKKTYKYFDLKFYIDDAPTIEPSGNSGVFIPDISVEQLRNASLEGVEELLAEGVMRDVLEPSGDLISRQWLLDLYDIDTTGFKKPANVPLEVVIQNIKDAPSVSAKQTIIGIDIPYGSDKGLATVFKGKDDKLILEKVKEICLDDFTDRPSVSIQPKAIVNNCDLISREEAIKECYRQAKGQHNILYPEDVDDILSFLPSADRPHGEWIDWLGKGNEWECSVCKCSIESHGSIAYNFCPICGADMRGNRR